MQGRYVVETGEGYRPANSRRDVFQRNFGTWVPAPEVSRGLSCQQAIDNVAMSGHG